LLTTKTTRILFYKQYEESHNKVAVPKTGHNNFQPQLAAKSVIHTAHSREKTAMRCICKSLLVAQASDSAGDRTVSLPRSRWRNDPET